jgi:hypothetical protein
MTTRKPSTKKGSKKAAEKEPTEEVAEAPVEAAEEEATAEVEASEEEVAVEPAAPEGANDDEERDPPSKVITMAKPLALKMARVMSEVRHVPKNGRNDFHGYDYVCESDLVDKLRGKLAEQGVAIFPSIREHTVERTKDARGKIQYLATVTLEITFIDGESGDQVTTTWVGQGVDQGDKSYYKAYTGAFKHALLKTFLVTASEPEQDARMRAPGPSRGRGGRARGRR